MKTRALVLCGDPWHPAATIRQGLAPLEIFGFNFEFLDDDGKWSEKMMMKFPVVVLAKANMVSATDDRAWLATDTQPAFRNFVRHGGGLLVIHAGTARYEKLPEMRGVTGGAFLHHPPQCRVAFEPEISHLLAEGVAPFRGRDEHYFMELDDAAADVFLHSHSGHGVQPAGWTRIEGKGRVCVLTPGHNLEIWLHPSFQKLLLNALRWSAK